MDPIGWSLNAERPAFPLVTGAFVGLPGLEPGTSSLSAKCREPLCYTPFPQVALNRRGRSYVLSSRPVMCSHPASVPALALHAVLSIWTPYRSPTASHISRPVPHGNPSCSRSRSSSGMLRTVARGSFPSVYPRACPTAPSVTASAHLGRCPLRTSCERPTRGGRVVHALAGCCRWIRWVQTWGTRVATWLGTPAGPGRRC